LREHVVDFIFQDDAQFILKMFRLHRVGWLCWFHLDEDFVRRFREIVEQCRA
jgi:hypothetical protein